MILLDTDVVSAVMKPVPVQAVLDWLDRREAATLYLSSISIAEIRYGLRILPDGKRRRDLEERFDRFVARGSSTESSPSTSRRRVPTVS